MGTFGDEFAVDFRGRVELGEDNHAFSNLFPLDALECEGGGLAGGAHWYRDTFSLDGSDVGGRELAEAVRTDEDGVAGVDYSYCVMSQSIIVIGKLREVCAPLLTTPETTVPTKGTEKVSFTWNSNGA